MNELRTKLLEIGNPMPNIIFRGDLNFLTIDWQMETADGGTHANQVQANAFLQFAQEQCLQQYIEGQREKITYSMSFSLTMTGAPSSPKHK